MTVTLIMVVIIISRFKIIMKILIMIIVMIRMVMKMPVVIIIPKIRMVMINSQVNQYSHCSKH